VISAKKSKTEDVPEGKKYSEKSIIAEQSAAGKNTWFMTIEDGVLLIGVERPFLIEIGSIESVYLPRVGDEIRQGSNFFQIFSSDFRTFSVTAPFSGIIKEVNEAVINRPNQTLEDPYDTGWLIKMMPSKFEEELRSLSLKY
jgi:glycine cleavage system H protein